MIHTLHTTMRVGRPPAEVFPFFADAGNLARITPPEVGFEFVTPLPIAMGEGTLIEYRLRLFGIGIRWCTRIERWEPDDLFVDVQLRGPYRLWEHTHLFRAVDGGTEIEDRVRYALPLPPIGEMAHSLVRRQLDAIFRFRENAVRRHFGEAPA